MDRTLDRLKEGIGYLLLLGAIGVLGLGFFLGSSGLFLRADDLKNVVDRISALERTQSDMNADIRVIKQELQDRLPPMRTPAAAALVARGCPDIECSMTNTTSAH